MKNNLIMIIAVSVIVVAIFMIAFCIIEALFGFLPLEINLAVLGVTCVIASIAAYTEFRD